VSARARRRAVAALAAAIGAAPAAADISGTLGWHELPNTRIRSVCPPPAQYPEIQGAEGCSAITEDWSGAAFDPGLDRLLILGGGHGGYAGNEVYALELASLTLRRLNAPSTPVRDGCQFGGTYADGRPVSRHTYDHLAWLPGLSRLLMVGGSQWQCGFFAGDAWTFDPAANAWVEKSYANAPKVTFGLGVTLDPNTGLLYAHDDFDLFSYDAAANQWTRRAQNQQGPGDYKSAVIDPRRKRYFYHALNNRTLFWYDITSPTGPLVRQSGATTGCDFMDTYAAGWEYDPVLDRLVAWNGGDTVYLLDPDTRVCTAVTHAGGPAAVDNGTFGRFRYSPLSQVYVTCNDVDDNCFALRLSPPTAIFRDGFESGDTSAWTRTVP
jgi:hypothetical protein